MPTTKASSKQKSVHKPAYYAKWLLITSVLLFVVGYVFLLLALDSGKTVDWLLTIFILVWAIKRLSRSVKTIIKTN
jgi:uncharacterized membrane protein HdeD (DUF308 family)